jgi:amino acid transporter
MVVLWVGMLATVLVVIVSGLSHFDSRLAFELPAGALRFDGRQALGLGTALSLAMYSYLGYYQVCYLGDEVSDPPRTLPRSIIVSVIAIALVYLTMNVSILGVIPWREAMASRQIASDLMFRLFGPGAARAMTLMIVWTAAAAAFAGLLGYSRVPYAAARSGHFFRALARTHPTADFPHRSLVLVGGLATLACLADLTTVIQGLLTSRILIQFVAQIATVFYIRTRPELLAKLPFRMRLFPVPALLALAGWLYIFGTSKPVVIAYGAGSLALGFGVFAVWDWLQRNASKGSLAHDAEN